MTSCHCVICGGPAEWARIAQFPRSNEFEVQRSDELYKLPDSSRGHQAGYCRITDGARAVELEIERWNVSEYLPTFSLRHYATFPSATLVEQQMKTYDRNVVTDADLRWSGVFHALGYNKDAPGKAKAFISGPGSSNGHAWLFTERGSDPNQPAGMSSFCYAHCQSYKRDYDTSYPFHWPCLELLARAIVGTSDVTQIDKDILFETLTNCQLMGSVAAALEAERFWKTSEASWSVAEAIAGMEFMARDPSMPQHQDLLYLEIQKIQPTTAGVLSRLDLEQRVRRDPFSNLPIEIILQILGHLNRADMLSCIRASWIVLVSTRQNNFWVERMRIDMPWFWELREIVHKETLLSVDLKAVYLWANEATTPKKWMTGMCMGLANRRRIWLLCELLAEAYNTRKCQAESAWSTSDSLSIYNHSEAFNVLIAPPRFAARVTNTVNTLWLHSWDDLMHHGAKLTTYWDAGGLTGIEMRTDTNTWLHGERNAESSTFEQFSHHINVYDWIDGFILHINCHEDKMEHQPRPDVEAITVLLTSGNSFTLREDALATKALCVSPFLLSPQQTMTGLTGVVYRGKIVSLGLMQCVRPSDNSFTLPIDMVSFALSEDKDALRSKTGFFKSDLSSILGRPFWELPGSYITRSNRFSQLHLEPQHILLLASTERELSRITKLYVYTPPSEAPVKTPGTVARKDTMISAGDNSINFAVAGMAVEFVDRHGMETRRFIDSGPASRAKLDDLKWPDNEDAPKWEAAYTHSFDIDGPGGERLTLVEWHIEDTYGTLTFHTNHNCTILPDPSTIFGTSSPNPRFNPESGLEPSTCHRIAPRFSNQFIAGIILTFGPIGGYDPVSQKSVFHHRRMSDIGLLTLPCTNPSFTTQNDGAWNMTYV